MIPDFTSEGPQAVNDCLRDVSAMAMLPMMWSGVEPIRIAESLAAALFTTLDPEFVLVAFLDDACAPLVSTAQVDRYESLPALAEQLTERLHKWARTHDPDKLLEMPNPLRPGMVCVTARALGAQGKHGVIAAGFAKSGAPAPAHHLVLNVAASQATTGIRNALLLRSLRESEARFKALIDVSAQIVWTTDGDGKVVQDSPSWRAFTGQSFEEWAGFGWLDVIHPDDRDRVAHLWRSAVAERIPVNIEYRLRHVSGEWRWTSVRAVPRFDAEGHVREWVGMNVDITVRKNAETTQQLLLGELNHRVKNTLASVQAVAQQTLRRAKSPSDFVSSFSGRIQSLARVHTQLTETNWQGADLDALIRDQLVHGSADESRLNTSGPTVGLQPQMALHLAMILHELATNSCKYGSMSAPAGSVTVEWTINGGNLQLSWIERGGPPVAAPTNVGFGTVLINQSVRAQGGSAQIVYGDDGVQWQIVLPLPGASAEPKDDQPEAAPADSAATPRRHQAMELDGGRHGSLSGKRILVVEDEYVIALGISANLQEAGATPVGPAYSLDQALRLIETEWLHGALLDANLSGASVEEAAKALVRRNIPFAFVTGYSRDTLPAAFREARVLAKPFNTDQLIDTVRHLLTLRAADVAPVPERRPEAMAT